MMKRIYFILSLLFAASLYVLADDCSDALNEAKNLYNNGNYQKAKALFEYVKSECGSNYGEATNWIARCEDALTPKLSLSRTRVSVGPSSGSATITVTSNRTWVLKNTSSNLFTVSKSGNTITIQYHSNSSTSSQSDYFDVETTDGAKSVRVNFYQEPRAATSSLSVSTTSISCSASGTTEYITVTSSKSWEVQYPSGSMYSVTRSGNTLTVRINENTSSESRTDFFNVKTTDGSKVQKIQLSQDGRSSSPASATFSSIDVSHNVYQNNIKGMLVKVDFTIYNMLNTKCYIIMWVYDSNGNNQKSYATSRFDSYINNDHCVISFDTFTPRYESSVWTDYELFLPNELISSSGYFVIELRDYNTNETIKRSEKTHFTLTR